MRSRAARHSWVRPWRTPSVKAMSNGTAGATDAGATVCRRCAAKASYPIDRCRQGRGPQRPRAGRIADHGSCVDIAAKQPPIDIKSTGVAAPARLVKPQHQLPAAARGERRAVELVWPKTLLIPIPGDAQVQTSNTVVHLRGAQPKLTPPDTLRDQPEPPVPRRGHWCRAARPADACRSAPRR